MSYPKPKRKILIYEFMCAGGAAESHISPSLFREGSAMLGAIGCDLVAAGHDVAVMLDERIANSQLGPQLKTQSTILVEAGRDLDALKRQASRYDWVIVVAPEFDGLLCERIAAVASTGGRLLGPDLQFSQIASDKLETNRRLAAAQVPVPTSIWIPRGSTLPNEFSYPAIAKPRDGAGSLGVRWIGSREDGLAIMESSGIVLETFVPGTAASISILSGPCGSVLLEPALQNLSQDGTFAYLGGSLPMPSELADRARELANRALTALPATVGYWGLDIVLGRHRQDDKVIEVNPRLTTSYVGLRKICGSNLAQAMVDVAEGRGPLVTFDRDQVWQFDADGWIRKAA